MNLSTMLQEYINTNYASEFVGVDTIYIIPNDSGFYEVWYHVAGERGDYFRGTYASLDRARWIASSI